jgi:hypothetical protein
MSRTQPQLIVCSYHKSGTSLLLHVMTKVCERLGLTLGNCFGLVDRIAPEHDVVLLPHSMLRAQIDWPYRAIRMIRDPRDIWVSGYLYHRHCREEWCVNSDLDPSPPIAWPRVDHAFAHRSEDWKRDYLERLGGRSYQQNLLDRSFEDGLDFELEGYTGGTLAAMREWDLNGVDAMDVTLESAMADFDGAMRRIFDHFGFTAEQSEAALEVAASEDVRRMDDAAIANRPQIHSREISKWRGMLPESRVVAFEAAYCDLIRELGYALASVVPDPPAQINAGADFCPEASFVMDVDAASLAWPDVAQPREQSVRLPAVAPATQDADVRLSVDGVIIRPTINQREAFSFVVPAGAERVRLESRSAFPAWPGASNLDAGRPLGIRVRDIVIRSRLGVIVIPADDPRLVEGWHDAEFAGAALWRWTDGSALLPQACVPGSAVVTVHCTTLAAYPVSAPTREASPPPDDRIERAIR